MSYPYILVHANSHKKFKPKAKKFKAKKNPFDPDEFIEDSILKNKKKGGKRRRRTRRKRGKGKVFSSLEKLYETLAEDQYNATKIFFKIGNDGFVKEGTLLELADISEQKVLPVLQEGPLDLKRLKWEDLKRGDTKVKKEQDEDWWQYYEEGAKGGKRRRRTRRKRDAEKRK